MLATRTEAAATEAKPLFMAVSNAICAVSAERHPVIKSGTPADVGRQRVKRVLFGT
jgi:hypothetical protein